MKDDIDEEMALGELRRIVNSHEMRNAKRLKEFITYAVFETLAGAQRNLSGYAIGVEVFGRRPDFDAQSDAVVRVSANKLRLKLEHYYNNEGRNNPLRIAIPKGSYRVEFKLMPARKKSGAEYSGENATPIMLVDAFDCLSQEPEHQTFCQGLFSEVCLSLANLDGFMLLMPPQLSDLSVWRRDNSAAHADTADFLFGCNVRWTPTHVRLISQLIDMRKGCIAWIGAKDFRLDPADVVSTQRGAASYIANEIQLAGEMRMFEKDSADKDQHVNDPTTH